MKRAIRILILVVGFGCTYLAVAAAAKPAPDGQPMPTCNPKNGCH